MVWTSQELWLLRMLGGRDHLYPIDLAWPKQSSNATFTYDSSDSLNLGRDLRALVQLQFIHIAAGIYSAETDAGTPSNCCPLRAGLKNQGFSSRLSFHSNASWCWLVSPQDWPAAVTDASSPTSKTGKLTAAEEALLGNLNPVQQSNQWPGFIPSDTQPAKRLQNEQYTESAAHIETPSITTQHFLQRDKTCLCMRAGTRSTKSFKIMYAIQKTPFFPKFYLYKQEPHHTSKYSHTYRRQHSTIT